MSGPRIASTSSGSIVSTVAERRSSSNIASSPKMSPGPERGERDLAAVGVLADRPRVAGADDVARVRLVALAEHDLARAEAPRVADLGHQLEVVGRQRREDRHLAEELDRLLCARRHSGGSTTPGGEHTSRVRPLRAPARGGGASRRGRRARPSAARIASGSRTARAITSTPAITSSTRPASPSASPGVQRPPADRRRRSACGRPRSQSRRSRRRPAWPSCGDLALARA